MRANCGALRRVSWSALTLTALSAGAHPVQAYSLTQMVTDYERPYVYALDKNPATGAVTLLFINTQSELVERSIPIGSNATDMAIHYGERRLYVANWGINQTRVVDLITQTEIAPLALGTDVYKINAGRTGRICYEGKDQWVHGNFVDTSSGAVVGQLPTPLRAGDGEFAPGGDCYFHCDSNSSNARITKYDVSSDAPLTVSTSVVHQYGSRNLLLSRDGSRLFWQGYIYDASLNELGHLGAEIYATTLHGDLAFSSTQVFNTHTGTSIHALPATSQVMAVSGDQTKLFLFNAATSAIVVAPMADLDPIPGQASNPDPQDGSTVSLPVPRLRWDSSLAAVFHQVYFGTNAAAVGAATPSSPEYLGEATTAAIDLAPSLSLGSTYYWRVDDVSSGGVRTGPVWRFTAAPLMASPNAISLKWIQGAPAPDVTLSLSAGGASLSWSLDEDAPWLSASASGGVTPDQVTLAFDVTDLALGIHLGAVHVHAGASSFDVPVKLEVVALNLTRMLTDRQRPIIYALQKGSGATGDASLVFIDTESESIERVIPIGTNPTDMAVHYGEGRLYVSDWQQLVTHVVDLSTQTELPPLALGGDVYRINAGRPGRIYAEQEDQWITVRIVNTATGAVVGQLPGLVYEGDGEIDPTGQYYYHCENGVSNAHITKYDVSTDAPVQVAMSPLSDYHSGNLVLAPDGQRLFWKQLVYTPLLSLVGNLGVEIYAASTHGEFAASQNGIIDVPTGQQVRTLPVASQVIAFARGDNKVFEFDAAAAQLRVLLMDGDGDGVLDHLDNCVAIANQDQADEDADGVGDACDTCPAIANPTQSERAACLEVAGGGADCLHAEVDLVGDDVSGTLTVEQTLTSIPVKLRLDVLFSNCLGQDSYSLYLNDGLVASISTGYVVDCSCTPPVKSYEVTDEALIARLWNALGSNEFRFRKWGIGSSLAWARLTAYGSPGISTACLFDQGGGSCDATNRCTAGSTGSTVDVRQVVQTPFVIAERISAPIAGSVLPRGLSISGLEDGSYNLCVHAGGASDCRPFTKGAEKRLRINEASCADRPPTADAGAAQAVECTGGREALVELDGSGSADADSTPETNDDIASFVWSEAGAPIGDGAHAAAHVLLGVHTIHLDVVDQDGVTARDDTVVTVRDTTGPVLICAATVRVECQQSGRAMVAVPPASASDTCFGEADIVNDRTSGGADASGSYPFGETTVTFTATDGAGNTATCSTVVDVIDTTPPVVSVEAVPDVLWPPDHQLRATHSHLTAVDACDPSPRVVLDSVVSSEPDDAEGGGDGRTANDIQQAAIGTPDLNVTLRAERWAGGPGRTYTLTYRAIDASGNGGRGDAIVQVPPLRDGHDESLTLRVDKDSATELSWELDGPAQHFDVIRGRLAEIRANGSDADLGAVSCLLSQAPPNDPNGAADPVVPQPGEGFFYLVQYYDGTSESSYGEPSADKARVPGVGSQACD